MHRAGDTSAKIATCRREKGLEEATAQAQAPTWARDGRVEGHRDGRGDGGVQSANLVCCPISAASWGCEL